MSNLIADLGPTRLDLVVAEGKAGSLHITFTQSAAAYPISGTPSVTVLSGDQSILTLTSSISAVSNNVIEVAWEDDIFDGLGGRQISWFLDLNEDGQSHPVFAGQVEVLSPGFAGISTSRNVTAQVINTSVVAQVIPVSVTVSAIASNVAYTPSDPLTASNVQSAIAELASQVQTRIPPVKSSVFIEENSTPTVIATQNVAVKAAGAFQSGPACQSCSYSSNRITYNGTRDTRVMAVASMSVESSNNQTFILELRKNGSSVDGARVRVRRFNAIANGSIAAMIPLVAGDFVELWITNTTSSEDPTVVEATFALMN